MTIVAGHSRASERIVLSVEVFELALDCSGSYLTHFNIDENSEKGREGRELLMVVLEPLFGQKVDYVQYMVAVNQYRQSRRYRNEVQYLKENIRRFLDEATRSWKNQR